MVLGLSWIEWLWFPQGVHLILVTVVLSYASPGPSDSVRHLGLQALVTLLPTWAKPGSGDSGPHLVFTWIW